MRTIDALAARRINMVQRESEDWRPPLFEPPAVGQTPKDTPMAALRRYFDLQAGSVWNDVAAVLATQTGIILDVGCGAQPYRPLVPPDARYRGIDTAAAEARFGYRMPDTEYFEGDIWPVDAASVDFAMATETLEHVYDCRRFLAESARVLKPGGTLLLTVPFAARWHFIPYDYWRYTPSSLNLLLEEAGFQNVRVYARGNATTVACYKAMALILRFLMPQTGGTVARLVDRLIGLPLVPLFIALAFIANLSLRGPGGDDCLGYTALAQKRSER